MYELWSGLAFPESSLNAPIVTLALRIFSVCTNSASCERLFSSFGDILTRKRSRLSGKNLVALAELKLHLQEDEAQSVSKKHRIKQYIDAVKQQKQLETQAEEAETSTGSATDELSSVTNNQMATTLQHIITRFTAEEDTETITTTAAQQLIKIPLYTLFNFSYPFWKTALEKDMNVLIDEMEIQEMAEGLTDEESERLTDIYAF